MHFKNLGLDYFSFEFGFERSSNRKYLDFSIILNIIKKRYILFHAL
jgi:hypothetical protein